MERDIAIKLVAVLRKAKQDGYLRNLTCSFL